MMTPKAAGSDSFLSQKWCKTFVLLLWSYLFKQADRPPDDEIKSSATKLETDAISMTNGDANSKTKVGETT